jgi:hypothetical protein
MRFFSAYDPSTFIGDKKYPAYNPLYMVMRNTGRPSMFWNQLFLHTR